MTRRKRHFVLLSVEGDDPILVSTLMNPKDITLMAEDSYEGASHVYEDYDYGQCYDSMLDYLKDNDKSMIVHDMESIDLN